ncbi:MAG TPA: L,D-transpeptidase, partial [Gemmatimonadaceae bacterium]|nr:L,D-transpeptidase [Gemmatimonadaceae bacterium]
LVAAAGGDAVTTRYTVTETDLQGPFVQVPERVYDQAKLPCMCYSSPAEALAERFHASEKLLAQLNPGVNLAALAPGAILTVPNVKTETEASSTSSSTTLSKTDTAMKSTASVDSASKPVKGRGRAAERKSNPKPTGDSSITVTTPGAATGGQATLPTGKVEKLVISKKDFWIHAVDAAGNVLYHFPSTLGAGYDPSPTGDFKITNIAQDPTFHYQPKLFAEVADDKPTARLPKGPNSPVGVVWMAISKPHYGIHGTSAPETIGYSNSHGCVRLTNWDARKLSKLVSPGIKVEFK